MSGTGRGPVALSAGCRLVLAGTQWQVQEFEPHTGRVLLRRGDGQELATTVRALVNRSDCRPAPDADTGSPHGRGRQPAGLEDLTARQRELVAMRYAHLMEAETGYRSGSPLHALPGEPRPGYDPAVTTLHQRRLAKVAEMAGLGADSAAMLGLARISERTLARWAGQSRRSGITGCIDGNWLRAERAAGIDQRAGPRGHLRGARRVPAPVAGLDGHQGETDPPVRPGAVRTRGQRSPPTGRCGGSGPNGSVPAVPGSVTPGRRRSCRSPASMW